jgi:hypothetical protein
MSKNKKIQNVFIITVLISALSFVSCTSIKTQFVTKPFTERETIYKHSSDDPQTDNMIPEKTPVKKYTLEMQQTKYIDVPKTLGLVGILGIGATVLAYTVAQIWVISWLPW